jgi:hypothetical protein
VDEVGVCLWVERLGRNRNDVVRFGAVAVVDIQDERECRVQLISQATASVNKDPRHGDASKVAMIHSLNIATITDQ